MSDVGKCYRYDMRNTDCECHVVVTTPMGRVKKKRFRNGYAAASVSARNWIWSQIQVTEAECKINNKVCPDIYVDGVQVISSNPPSLQEAIEVLKRVAACVVERGPDSGELFEASCDAMDLVARYENSLKGKLLPKEIV